jgi:hypothetical protein
MSGAIRLEVPGDSVYSFAPRVVAAWLVATSGAEIEAVEDARLAVDELIAPFAAAGRAVEVSFGEDATGVWVEIAHRGEGGPVRLSPLAQRILAVVAADCHPLTDGRSGFWVRLRSVTGDRGAAV